jgi:hypothetical protein
MRELRCFLLGVLRPIEPQARQIIMLLSAIAVLSAPPLAIAKRRVADPAKTLTMWKASFADDLSASSAVKDECQMEELLNEYIKSNAPERGAAIKFAESEAQFVAAPNQLHVLISDVDSNEWRFFRVRPSSLVTFDIKIIIDGATVQQVRKQIRSGGPFGFGVCQRVNKIAKAGGEFAAEWVARADYQTVAYRTKPVEPMPLAQTATIPPAAAALEIDAARNEASTDQRTSRSPAADDPVKRLEQLDLLRDRKLISPQEYESKRRDILDSI